MKHTTLVAAVAVNLWLIGSARGDDLTSLSIEQLLDIEVTIVSKTEERFADAAAALTVITAEDLRAVGARSYPEALRLVPGLHVSRASASSWAVSSRGFSNINSAKLLVLEDGRSVYTPLFSGVFWDVQDSLLADVDRIEVVRGPGAALWGANAMNGVVNIRTKDARETQGGYLEVGAGTEHRAFAGARYGGHVGDSVFYRVYGKVFTDDGGYNPAGPDADEWQMARLGFRVDAQASAADSISLSGGYYAGVLGQVAPALSIGYRPPPAPPLEVDLGGGHVNFAWTRRFGAGADAVLRVTYDRTQRNDPTFSDHLDIFDLGLKTRIELPGAQELVLGASFRQMVDEFVGKGILELRPPTSLDNLVSAFAQDTLALFGRSLRLTVGAKLEHNDFSGLELQPGVRVAWEPAHGHTVWAAVSRAVRVPTRLERDIFADATNPAAPPTVHLLGNPDLEAEVLIAGELGYRLRPAAALLVDLAGFYFRYDRLITFEIGMPFMENGDTVYPVRDENAMHGHSLGGEVAVTWAPRPSWQVVATYSYCQVELTPDGMDPTMGERMEDASPRHQVSVRSALDLPAGLRFDLFARWVDSVETADPNAPIDDHLDLDVRLSWQVGKQIEASLVWQNLLQGHHREFPGRTEVERSVYGMVSAAF